VDQNVSDATVRDCAVSELVVAVAAIDRALDTEAMEQHLKGVPDDDLPVLYETFRSVHERSWQCQCLVVTEMMRRVRWGEGRAESVREALGMGSVRTVQYRAAVGAMLTDPEVQSAVPVLGGETWFRIATDSPDPKAAIVMAADRKAADPGYSTRQFAAEVRGQDPPTIERIVLVGEDTGANVRLAERLARSYNVRVEIREVLSAPPLGAYGPVAPA